MSVSRGTSRSDGRHLPGPYKWYNETWHWSDNRTRGYDPDLDGTTLPPEPDKTLDEEEWDGTDFYRPPFDDRHPLGRVAQPLTWDLTKLYIVVSVFFN